MYGPRAAPAIFVLLVARGESKGRRLTTRHRCRRAITHGREFLEMPLCTAGEPVTDSTERELILESDEPGKWRTASYPRRNALRWHAVATTM
jgi:hypothetical protein